MLNVMNGIEDSLIRINLHQALQATSNSLLKESVVCENRFFSIYNISNFNGFTGTTFTPISPHPIHGHALASPTRRWSTAQASASTPKSDRSSTELVSPLTPRYPPAPPPGGAGQPPSFQTQLNFSGQAISPGHYKVRNTFLNIFVLGHFAAGSF